MARKLLRKRITGSILAAIMLASSINPASAYPVTGEAQVDPMEDLTVLTTGKELNKLAKNLAAQAETPPGDEIPDLTYKDADDHIEAFVVSDRPAEADWETKDAAQKDHGKIQMWYLPAGSYEIAAEKEETSVEQSEKDMFGDNTEETSAEASNEETNPGTEATADEVGAENNGDDSVNSTSQEADSGFAEVITDSDVETMELEKNTLFLYSEEPIYLNPDSSNIFRNMEKLEEIKDVEKLDFSYVETLKSGFAGDVKLESIEPLADVNTSSLADVSYLFQKTGIADDDAEGLNPHDVFETDPETEEKTLLYRAWDIEAACKGTFEETDVETYPSWYSEEEQQEEPEKDPEEQPSEEETKSESSIETEIITSDETETVSEASEETKSEDKKEDETKEEQKEEQKAETPAESKTETAEDADKAAEKADDKETAKDDNEEINAVDYVAKEEVTAVDVQGIYTEDEDAAKKALEEKTAGTLRRVAPLMKNLRLLGAESEEQTSFAEGDVPRQGDGSNIESISAKWITPDTVDNGDLSLLYIKPEEDEKTSVRMRINYALSGEHNYEPGDITITVPAHIIKDCDGNDYGNMIIPFPESPTASSDFNWSLIDDNYVLTNTKRMSAATKGFIEFAVTGLIPHRLVDMQLSDEFKARIEVVTHAGNLIGLTSNSLTAQFDTEAKITNTTKRVYGAAERVKANAIPEGQRIAGEEEYIKVRWYVFGYTVANTEYSLDIKDVIPDEYNGFLINATSDDKRESQKRVFYGYTDGNTPYYYFESAYPASQFEPDTEYTFHNTATMIVTERDPEIGDDPQLVTQKEASAQTTYSYTLPKWENPTGHFMVVKDGNDDKVGNNTIHLDYRSADDNHIWARRSPIDGWYGIYPSGLNELQDQFSEHGTNGSINLSYTIDSIGYVMPWMYDESAYETEHELAPRFSKNYNKPVQMVTTDTGVSFGKNTPKLKVFDDYNFVSVEFPDSPWLYTGVPKNINPDGSWTALTAGDGTFEYEKDNDMSHWPDITLQIQRNGEWEDYATASWKTGTFVATLTSGSTQSDKVINLPADTENFRTLVTLQNTAPTTAPEIAAENKCLQAALDYDMRVVISLRSTSSLMQTVEALFAKSNKPFANVFNGVVLNAYDADNEEIVEIKKEGYDSVRGYTTDIAVVPEKTSVQKLEEVDFTERNILIHYAAKVHEQSVINDRKTYDEAVAEGRLQVDTHGYWYDLLPKGVTPLTNTVRLRNGDKVIETYTVENYKNSGRTMLIVECALKNTPISYRSGDMYYYEDVPEIQFDALYNFDSFIDYGDYIHNVIAFQSGNAELGDVENYRAEPDDPNSNNNIATVHAFNPDDPKEKQAMTNLDPEVSTNSFVYAGTWTRLDLLSAGRTSLFKEVMTNNDGWWSDGLYYNAPEANKRTVLEGGVYSYRLRMMSDDQTISKDLIMYDSLENFYAGSGNDTIDIDAPRWQGTLRRVDVSHLESLGCAPVIYYSTVENLQLSDENDPDSANTTNVALSNSSIWVKAEDYNGKLEDVKAVAVDASKRTDGTDFELAPLDSAVVIIEMHAPYGEPAREYISQQGIWGDSAHAYNNAYLLCTSIDKDTLAADSDNFVRKDYTKVGLEENSLEVTKVWDDDNNRDGIRPTSVTVRLFANGDDSGQFVELTDAEPTKSFEHIPYTDENGEKIRYTLREDPVANYSGTIAWNGNHATITNTHEPEKITISGEKVWTGDAVENRPDQIEVRLFADGEYLKHMYVRPNADGNWPYTFEGLFKNNQGHEITYTVQEVLTGKGKSYVSSVDGLTITNTYHPYGNLRVEKEVLNTTSVSVNTEFPFTFTFTKSVGGEEEPVFDSFAYDILNAEDEVASSGTLASNDTIAIKGGEKILVKEIPENVVYKVAEAELPGFTQTASTTGTGGSIRPNDTVTAHFENKYAAGGYLNLAAHKTLKDRKMSKYQFRFELYDSNNNLIKTASTGTVEETVNREDGTLDYTTATARFGSIRYTEADAGQTYEYTLKEYAANKAGYVYDNTVYTVKVAVVDNGNGTLSITPTYFKNDEQVSSADFVNEYKANGTLDLSAWKNLQGRTLQEGEFTFKLYDEEGNVLQTKTNNAPEGGYGPIVWDPLNFTEKDIGKTLHFYAKEVAGEDDTVIYDTTTYGYQVKILDNGDGTLSFTQENATPIFGESDPGPEPETVKYAVSLYGIGLTTDEDGQVMGLTFGPALGSDYSGSYHEHTPSESTTLGNEHRCIHNDDWATIIHWNNEDPEVYEQCIEEGCTHSVELDLSATETLMNPEFNASYTGDGPSALFYELAPYKDGQTTINYENLEWNPLSNYGSVDGGWGASRVRAMLNGADELTSLSDNTTSDATYAPEHASASIYSETNSLINAFPKELQAAIGKRAIEYDPIWDDLSPENARVSNDKLWLLSPGEGYDIPGNIHDEFMWPYFDIHRLYTAYRINSHIGGTNAEEAEWWLRTIGGYAGGNPQALVDYVNLQGEVPFSIEKYPYEANGVSPCFSLSANAEIYTPSSEPVITGWETEEAEAPVFKNKLKDGDLTVTKHTIVPEGETVDENQIFHFKVMIVADELPNFDVESTTALMAEEITVRYHLNYGDAEPDEITYRLNDRKEYITDSEVPDPEREHYTFAGWYKDADCTQEFDGKPLREMDVYAKWTPVEYSITYELDGGTNNANNSATFTVEDLPLTLRPATPNTGNSSGKAFDCWCSDSELTTKVTEITEPGNTTVYAKWKEPPMKYAVSLYGIGVDQVATGTVSNDNDTATGTTSVETETAGLTFGPALGANYVTSFKSHTPSGTTTHGNEHRCIHNDDWATIIEWNNEDPEVYEQCIAEGCTHSVELDLPAGLKNASFDPKYTTGDGPGALYRELMLNDSSYENLRWHPNNNRPGDTGNYGTNYEGWGATRIRAMMNGADALTDTGDGTENGDTYSSSASSDINKSASVYTGDNNLLSAFPVELKSAIGARVTKYDSVYNQRTEQNLKTSYDKLWLLSPNEIWTTAQHTNSYYTHPLEGTQYPYFASKSNMGTSSTISQNGTIAYYRSSNSTNTGSANYWWLRSSYGNSAYSALCVRNIGGCYYAYACFGDHGVSPCFSLARK